MGLSFLLVLTVTTFTSSTDSLQLPIKNGVIIQNQHGVDKLNKSLLIAPTDDFNIRSCLAGKVTTIEQDEWGYVVAVKSDSVVILYSVFDLISVKKGDYVKRGSVIGCKTPSSTSENCIMFSVFVNGRETEAGDYLVR